MCVHILEDLFDTKIPSFTLFFAWIKSGNLI